MRKSRRARRNSSYVHTGIKNSDGTGEFLFNPETKKYIEVKNARFISGDNKINADGQQYLQITKKVMNSIPLEKCQHVWDEVPGQGVHCVKCSATKNHC